MRRERKTRFPLGNERGTAAKREKQLDNVAVYLGEMLRDKGPGQILLTGTVSDRQLEGMCRALQPRLSPYGLTCEWGPRVSLDAHTLSKSQESLGVVLVEERGTSRFPEVEGEVTLFGEQGKPIFGCILIEK